MNANRIVIGFITCVTSLCLSGWSLVSSAAAATIVVTTTDDIVDPPFNASGLCGSGGTVADLPNAGSTVSLREAIIAANNTPGQKTIKFSSSLSGAIVLTGPLYLCGGHTTLNGDVNGDETPDVTVNGAAVTSASVIEVVSSHNTVKNLRVLAPHIHGVAGIEVSPNPAVSTTLMDNTLSHNLVTDGAIFVDTGSVTNGATVKHTIVRDNTVLSDLSFDIYVAIAGDHHEIIDLTIAGNTLSGANTGIGVIGGAFNDVGSTDRATDSRLDVTIKDNLVTGNSNPGDVAGIAIVGGVDSSSRNQVSAQLLNNTITDNTGIGIFAVAGAFGGSDDNHIEVTMRNNLVTGNSNPGDVAGILIAGGEFSSSHNQVSAQLLNNTISNNEGGGITALSGLDNSSDNAVEVTIRDNTLENNAGAGIVTYGAAALLSAPSDSSDNSLNARIERNTVKNAVGFGLLVFGGLGSFDGDGTKVANGNEVHAIVTDNTITGTLFGDGMNLEAGSSGEANDNEVKVNVRKNTVCGSAAADIHAIGGVLGSPFLPDNTGTGNILEGEISKNIASTIVVENGVAGNVATVARFHNAPCP
ncbi:MAG: right-handed parallel beta-helix repeat-containing protein [Deltaproteobacteria bacterium]|nr:right-handed parallel beta-helix repeat-containing protein [Deltaproteobacteria bacterium]